MTKSLIVSAAVAALLATTGLATAQGVNQGAAKESPAAASPKGDSAVPMNAPAAKGAETLPPPGATSKEGKPQHVQIRPEAKTKGDKKAEGQSKALDSPALTAASKDMKNPTAESKSLSESKSQAS
jgi:hypothetical protein